MANGRTGLVIGALVLAAVAVIGVVVLITGSWPASPPEEMAMIVAETPTPSPTTDMSRITPEAAMTADVSPSPEIAGVSMTAETGPGELALAVIGFLTLLGLGGSLLLAKFA